MPDNLFRKELFSERADWSFAAIDYLAFLMPFMMGFSEHCGIRCSAHTGARRLYDKPMIHFAPRIVSQIAANSAVSTMTAATTPITSKSPSSSR